MTNDNDTTNDTDDATLTRRTALAAFGVGGFGLLTSTASGQDGGPLPEGDGPPREVVETPQGALDWIEEELEDITNRPTNSYLSGGYEGWPQLAFDTAHTDEAALEHHIYKSAMIWARAINSGAPLRGVRFRVFHAELGEPYEYVASYLLTRDKAMSYTGGLNGLGSMDRETYIAWAQSRLRWRNDE